MLKSASGGGRTGTKPISAAAQCWRQKATSRRWGFEWTVYTGSYRTTAICMSCAIKCHQLQHCGWLGRTATSKTCRVESFGARQALAAYQQAELLSPGSREVEEKVKTLKRQLRKQDTAKQKPQEVRVPASFTVS